MSSSKPVFTASFITAHALPSPSYVAPISRPFCSCSYSSTTLTSDCPERSLYCFQPSKESNKNPIFPDMIKVLSFGPPKQDKSGALRDHGRARWRTDLSYFKT